MGRVKASFTNTLMLAIAAEKDRNVCLVPIETK